MHSALICRRRFLQQAGLAFSAALPPSAAFALSRTDAVFASGVKRPDGRFGLALLAEDGTMVDEIGLPGRAHGLGQCRVSGRVAAFARRPGTFMAIFSAKGAVEAIVAAADGRHFFGHGQFSPDGRLLYASENDFDGNRGMIGLYDATDGFRRVGEYAAYGIGTHDLTVSDDGRLLIAANGGIETHPDFGRTKLNLDRMEPSLALIDAASGALIERHALSGPLSQLSTRHVDTDADGRVWFACQYEGPRSAQPPLIGSFRLGEPLRFAPLPDSATAALANYVGAIAVHRGLGLIGVTSPKGNREIVFEAASGRVLRDRPLQEAAGIAPAPGGFAASSYRGAFAGQSQPVAFDQHIVRLGGRL